MSSELKHSKFGGKPWLSLAGRKPFGDENQTEFCSVSHPSCREVCVPKLTAAAEEASEPTFSCRRFKEDKSTETKKEIFRTSGKADMQTKLL